MQSGSKPKRGKRTSLESLERQVMQETNNPEEKSKKRKKKEKPDTANLEAILESVYKAQAELKNLIS
jgi:hypothetical protein